MKKGYLAVLLGLALAFSGCGNDKSDADVKATQESVEENTDEEKNDTEAATSDTVIGVAYSNKGTFEITFEEEEPYEYEYSYEVPKITDGSEEAEKINKDIYDFAASSIETVENVTKNGANMDTFVEPNFIEVSYSAFENDNIVSIVLKGNGLYSDWREYYVVNYDKSKKQRIENNDLLAAAGISEEDALNMARGSLGNQVLDNMKAFLDSDDGESEEDDMSWKGGMVADLIRDYANTIKPENVNSDMMMYLNGDNELSVIALVYVPAGAGQYYYDVVLKEYDTEDVSKSILAYADEYHYDGFEKQCMGLWDIEGFSVNITHEIEGGDEYTESVYMGFDDTDPSKYLLQYAGDRYSASYSGSIKVVGVDENGIKYEYEMTELDNMPIPEEQEQLKGTFYLSEYSFYDESMEEMISGSNYLYSDGYDMLDSKGEIVEMEKSFG